MADIFLASSFTSATPDLKAGVSMSNDSSRVSRQKEENPHLETVADQFEAIFVETLLRQARQSKLSDGLFENKTDDNFEQMFDQELANKSSKSVDIGIAESIVRQMTRTGI